MIQATAEKSDATGWMRFDLVEAWRRVEASLLFVVYIQYNP